MLNRAAVSMRNAPLVDDTVASTDAYHMKSSKPSAHLEAFTRISREYRHFATMVKASEPVEPDPADFFNYKTRTAIDTDLDPDNDLFLHLCHPTSSFPRKRESRTARTLDSRFRGNDGEGGDDDWRRFFLVIMSLPAAANYCNFFLRKQGLLCVL